MKRGTVAVAVAMMTFCGVLLYSGVGGSKPSEDGQEMAGQNLWGVYQGGDESKRSGKGKVSWLDLYPFSSLVLYSYVEIGEQDNLGRFEVGTCTLENGMRCRDGDGLVFRVDGDGLTYKLKKLKRCKAPGKLFLPSLEMCSRVKSLAGQECSGLGLDGMWAFMSYRCANRTDHTEKIFVDQDRYYYLVQKGCLVIFDQAIAEGFQGSVESLFVVRPEGLEHVADFSMFGVIPEMETSSDPVLVDDGCLCMDGRSCDLLDWQVALAGLFGDLAKFAVCLRLGGYARFL